ncbi:MAG: beta-hydroxyacyl-ACP dehydratase [Acidobacteriia bacterium]|nr:beta-hydroxyacyl-ACP dehydratase [Terriglobia bacterium]
MIMVDNVLALEPGRSIRATKNVTGNEIQLLGHFPEYAVMPGSMILEAIGQAASILFSKTTGTGTGAGEFLVLGLVDDMRFLVPVTPGDQMEISVDVAKIVKDVAFVKGVVTVGDIVVATGKLGFARRRLQAI